MALRTDYKDDILDLTQNTQRKYRMITNADGTVSFEDVTVYSQVGDSFGASQLNEIANAVTRTKGNIDYDIPSDWVQLKDANGNWQNWKKGNLGKQYVVQSGSVNTELVGSISNSGWYVYSTSYPVTSPQPVFSSSGFTITASGGTIATMGVGGTEYAVDLTNVNKICANINTSTYGGKLQVCKSSKILYYDSSYTSSAVVARKDFANTDNYVELDVSSLSGVHYIAITTAGSAGSVNVGYWWLE